MTQPPPIDYRTPQYIPRRPIFSWLACVIVAVPLLLLMIVMTFVMVFVIPRFETIFHDFGTRLPAATQLLIDVARWSQSLAWFPLLVLPVAAGFLIPLMEPPGQKTHRPLLLLLILVILATAVIAALVVIALFMPMLSLIQNVSSPHK